MTESLTLATLESAIANGELVLHYQPKVCLLSGRILGAEALVRWDRPDAAAIPPSLFIPLAESSGLLHDLTVELFEQVIDASCRLQQHDDALTLSMNVAPGDLESHVISDRLSRYLTRGTVRAEHVQIEITESQAMGNVERIRDDLNRLRDMGIRVLMDDFGTGYSSIDRLSQLPFTSLKLDQGVVRRMATSRQNLNVVKSAISMARELGMTSVAEGVETRGAYNFLIANGCEEAQGYFISRPLALEDFIGFLATPRSLGGSQIGRVHQAIYNILYYRKCLLDAAICRAMDDTGEYHSVLEPDFADSVESSRIGLWYFGLGQSLSHHASFAPMEPALRNLHDAGVSLVAEIANGDSDAVDAGLRRVDRDVNTLLAHLHQLERELLRELSGNGGS